MVGIRPSNGREVVTESEALSWIADMFEEPPRNVRRTTRRDQISAWDSLGQLILMAGLDQRFGIRLTPAELSSLASVNDVLHILETHECLVENGM